MNNSFKQTEGGSLEFTQDTIDTLDKQDYQTFTDMRFYCSCGTFVE